MFERNIVIRKYIVKFNLKYEWIKDLILKIRINSNLKITRIWLVEREDSKPKNSLWRFSCRSNVYINERINQKPLKKLMIRQIQKQ